MARTSSQRHSAGISGQSQNDRTGIIAPWAASRLTRRLLLGMTLTGIAVAILRPCQARAQVVDVSDTAQLAQAINSVNAGTATDINITTHITLNGNLPVITGNATIIGNGNTISGNNQFRVFFVL